MRSAITPLLLLATTSCGFRAVPLEDACFVYVVAADSHTCGRKTDGTLWCWGDNQYGQLGTGDTEPRLRPTWIESLGTDVKGIYVPAGTGMISSRTAFTCAKKTDNSLWCWGNNEYGQLGVGGTEPRLTPARVDRERLGNNVHAAYLGSGFACSRQNDNSIYCWGANESGQLGLGDTIPRVRPERVDERGLGTDVRYLSTGASHTCARKGDGSVWCWGDNRFGQLGTGDTEPSYAPIQAGREIFGAPADVIVTGGMHTCVSLGDASVWCFGANQYGQLGSGDSEQRVIPTKVELAGFAGGVSMLTAGGNHSCAVKTDGSIWCWGSNRAGQLGDGTHENRSRPVQVVSEAIGTSIGVIYAGGNHTCARTLDSAIFCWGSNEYGQLGLEFGGESITPAEISRSCP